MSRWISEMDIFDIIARTKNSILNQGTIRE